MKIWEVFNVHFNNVVTYTVYIYCYEPMELLKHMYCIKGFYGNRTAAIWKVVKVQRFIHIKQMGNGNGNN